MCDLKPGQPVFYRYHTTGSQLGLVIQMTGDPNHPVIVSWRDRELNRRNPIPYKGSIGPATPVKEQ